MKELIKLGLQFIKKNPSMLYSLFLIVIVTGIILFNSYYYLNKFQENTDALLQSKAVLSEDIFHILARDHISDAKLLNEKIREIKEKDLEIKEITISVPVQNEDGFNVIASTAEEKIGLMAKDSLNELAFNVDEGIAFLDNENNTRFWSVAKVIKDKSGNRVGLITFQLSLEDHDRFTRETLKGAYLVSLVSVIIVLLLTVNHARLFQYALKAAKLEEVDKMKDEFISMASHELRTPLTSIRGYVEILEDSKAIKSLDKDREELKFINNINILTSRLNILVSDILEVSRIEQNRIPIKIKEINLGDIIEKSIQDSEILAKEKGLELIHKKEKPSNVLADSDRLSQILENLLKNAIKYTEKGNVELSTKEDDKYLYIIVADTGIGISAEDAKNLFSKFYRVANEKTQGIQGTGLGLWISREIARKMKGNITVESIEGVGSHFTLKLPKAKN